jgi:hypothetical protein
MLQLAAAAAYCDGASDIIALLQLRHRPVGSSLASLFPEVAVHCDNVEYVWGGWGQKQLYICISFHCIMP